MRLDREEYLRRIGERIGDSDEDIAFLEDMTDTFDGLSEGTRQEEIDRLTAENAELRRRYKERFFSPGKPDDDPGPDDDPEPEEEKTRFEDLFKED